MRGSMTVKLGLNIPSLKVRRQLAQSTDRVGKVFERLASGQRINSAADDPAGLEVASELQADIRIANQARRNVSDGVSLLQVAEGAIEAISSLVERRAELAQQASNGIYSDEQRLALDIEYAKLGHEIKRITRSTEFNGINLLEGEMAALSR